MELTAGKVAVVTGAASGIGLALAERFARAGLDVVMADVEQPALQAASEKIAGLGGKTLAVPTDVSDEAAVDTLAAAAVDRFGAVHVVCNNAGVAAHRRRPQSPDRRGHAWPATRQAAHRGDPAAASWPRRRVMAAQGTRTTG